MNAFETSDGHFLRYYRNGTIWQSTISGENETRVAEASGWDSFRIARNAIWLLDDSIAPARFSMVDSHGPIPLGTLDIGPSARANRGFDVSPDGREILYTRVDSIESDIMLVENFH